MSFAFDFMTCSGFQIYGDNVGTSSCNMAWTMCVIAFMLVVFLALIVNRQAKDGVLSGMGYNVVGAIALGVILFYITTSIWGDARFSLIGGILGIAIGGFGLGLIWNMADGE